MLNYLIGKLKYLIRLRSISIFSLIDNQSSINRNVRVYRMVKVVHSIIGEFSYIAPNTEIIYAQIGKYCCIATDVRIGLPMHPVNFLSMSPIFYSEHNALKIKWTHNNYFKDHQMVTIGNDVWIGQGAKIMGGINIGNGAVIGAGAIVTKDIPDYAIAVGVPAKVIKYRFSEEIINELIRTKWWDLPTGDLRTNLDLFIQENLTLSELRRLKH